MKVIILAVILMISSAFAATNNTGTINKTKFDIRKPIKKWIGKMNDGFIVGIAQGSLATNLRARRNGGLDESINETRSTKMQLSFGWQDIKNQEFGYGAYFTYTDIADGLSELDGSNAEDIRSMRWSANATYGINEEVYSYGGLNLNKYYGSGDVEANIDRGIGYQAGVGFNIHERAIIELEYLALLNEGRISKTNIDVEAKGIMLKLNTPFTFDI
ncbi:MAG: hypothetical protein CME62_14795 [Halobacteriovoraceae bacterium]|nr:hypothetical protein [Halobacteriovoraceae bacterium]|tara:strand:+ start:10335 stop:10982 length:648 start_codon:yes stop_codon:yes gene_type:complete